MFFFPFMILSIIYFLIITFIVAFFQVVLSYF